MYYEVIQKHKKTAVVTVILLVIIIFCWAGATYISRIGKTSVIISAVPRDARVTLNGNDISNGTQWVQPGSYTITATKEGFKKQTTTTEVTPEKKQNVVALSLLPVSDSAKKWADVNQDDYQSNESYGAIEARVNGEYFAHKNPITRVLPYTDPYYELSYRADGDTVTITVATPSPRYRYLAIEKLRGLGYNPTDFRVDFSDFTNPLKGDVNE